MKKLVINGTEMKEVEGTARKEATKTKAAKPANKSRKVADK